MTTPQMWNSLRVADRQRREAVRAEQLIGLSAVDVESNGPEPALHLTFLGATPGDLVPSNIRIVAPPGTPAPLVISVDRRGRDGVATDGIEHLTVRLDRPGRAGVYRLRLVSTRRDGRPGNQPPRDVDPRFAEVAFSFDVDHPVPGPPARHPVPLPALAQDANTYLARDFAGLRTVLLDRYAQTQPTAAGEQHAADFAVALLELFAYLGDDLAYFQDDVATEAYLQTCRRRVSLRRHARLVGYRLHEGTHARTWVSFEVAAEVSVPLGAVRLGAGTATFTPIAAGADPGQCQETAHCYPSHNAMAIWTFGEHDAVLVAGATSMALVDGERASAGDRPERALELRVGDVLVLEASTDPSGLGPPDIQARHAVRLTSVHRGFDSLYQQAYLEVRWSFEEALPFDLSVSVTSGEGVRECARVTGNMVLVGHGEPVRSTVTADDPTLAGSDLTFAVPFPGDDDIARYQARSLRRLPEVVRHELEDWQHAANHGWPMTETEVGRLGDLFDAQTTSFPVGDRDEVAWRQADRLGELLIDLDRLLEQRSRRAVELARRCEAFGPLPKPFREEIANDWGDALGARLDPGDAAAWGPACAATTTSPAAAVPVVVLHPQPLPDGDATTADWQPVADLLRSDASACEFVVEMDDHRRAQLRFASAALDATTRTFTAAYWLGNGPQGNVTAEAIDTLSVESDDAAPAWVDQVRSVRNPLGAVDGVAPEDFAAAKRAIPGSFREDQPRALSADDYAAQAQRVAGVAAAAAQTTPGTTGRLVQVCVQPVGRLDPPAWFLREVEHRLRTIRRIGDDVTVGPPRYAAIDLALRVEPDDGADTAELAALVGLLLSAGHFRSGEPALFNPSELSFGQTLYASAIVARVQALPGVRDAVLTSWGFVGAEPGPAVPPTRLTVGPLQMPRLDNDPAHLEHGRATISIGTS